MNKQKDITLEIIKDKVFSEKPFTKYEIINEVVKGGFTDRRRILTVINQQMKERKWLFDFCKIRIRDKHKINIRRRTVEDVLFFLPKHKNNLPIDRLIGTKAKKRITKKDIESEIRRFKNVRKKLKVKKYNAKTCKIPNQSDWLH